MKLIITGGTLEAEFKNDPLARVQKQLASISQKSELGILSLKNQLIKLSEIKDGKLDELMEYFQAHQRLEDLEIEELKTMIIALEKDNTKQVTSLDMDTLQDKLKSNASTVKEVMDKINSRIDRILKDNADKVKRLQEEIGRIGSDGKKKITQLKQELSNISITRERFEKEADVKGGYPKVVKPPQKQGVIDGTKYMGRLNYKPKIPI